METLYNAFYIFYSQVMTKAPLLLGLVTCIGYLLLKQDGTTVVKGTVKTIVGFMLVQVGASTLVAGFKPVVDKIAEYHHLTGSVIDPYTTMMATMETMERTTPGSDMRYCWPLPSIFCWCCCGAIPGSAPSC